MTKRTNLRIADVAAALRNANGNRTAVAKALNLTRARLDLFIDERKSLQAVEEEIRESWVDKAEAELLSEESSVDFRKLQLILKTHGASRGYGTPPPPKPPEPFRVVSAITQPEHPEGSDDESPEKDVEDV